MPPDNFEIENRIELTPYFTSVLGEKETMIIMLRAERDMLLRQLQVMKLELEAHKPKKKESAEKT